MGNYIKTLILSTIVLVIGNNSNYCYSMEEIDTKEKINNNTNNYEEYYTELSKQYVENVSKYNENYKQLMIKVSDIFDDIIENLKQFTTVNTILELKTQTLKELELSITKNEKTKMFLNNRKIIERVQNTLNGILQLIQSPNVEYSVPKDNIYQFKYAINEFDKTYYHGSLLKNRFDILHKNIISTINEVLYDIDNNKRNNFKVYNIKDGIQNNIDYTSKYGSTSTKSLNNIKKLFKDIYSKYKGHFILKNILEKKECISLYDYLRNIVKPILDNLKSITDYKLYNQISNYNVLLDNNDEYNNNALCMYLKTAYELIDSLNYINNICNRKLIHCVNIINKFVDEYKIVKKESLNNKPSFKEWKLIYGPEQSLDEMFAIKNETLDNLEVIQSYKTRYWNKKIILI